MRRPFLTSTSLTLGLSLASCAEQYTVDPIISTERGTNPVDLEQGKVAWKEKSKSVLSGAPSWVINPYSYQPPGWPQAPYAIAVGTQFSSEERRTARNALQDALINVSADNTSIHLAGLRAAESNINVFLGAAGIGLSGGAAVATGAAAQALAAAATGMQGARALVNEQVYRNALTESIIRLIEADRAATLVDIHRKQAEPIGLYGVEAAIADANIYHLKGSFYHGLALLRAAAEAKASAAIANANASSQATSAVDKESAALVALRAKEQSVAQLLAVQNERLKGLAAEQTKLEGELKGLTDKKAPTADVAAKQKEVDDVKKDVGDLKPKIVELEAQLKQARQAVLDETAKQAAAAAEAAAKVAEQAKNAAADAQKQPAETPPKPGDSSTGKQPAPAPKSGESTTGGQPASPKPGG